MDEKEKLPIDIQAVIDLASKQPLEIRLRVLEKILVLLVTVLLCNFRSTIPGATTFIEAELEKGIFEIFSNQEQLESGARKWKM